MRLRQGVRAGQDGSCLGGPYPGVPHPLSSLVARDECCGVLGIEVDPELLAQQGGQFLRRWTSSVPWKGDSGCVEVKWPASFMRTREAVAVKVKPIDSRAAA
ncbi:hypothetical protein ADK86_35835 [Streptomyces sp. NRRL F-5755]|uniref:hypothetical protein n=1 Tax=Streptomyces sp. NRRL F-5755 TaxID=1519475 RepID=UPI0006AFF69D|nr:hypothetical protein [Streptomyces sp. NRRL F-5755]KOT87603.1 hypothetical protein ADK86_35835 [Streptomyces sp. NRRL F-5755]